MKDAVMALGMGGPDSVEAIKPFLYNLFSDREIINFRIGPLQTPLAKIIAASRSKKIAPEYLKMGLGGASPQNVYTKELLSKLSIQYTKRTGRELDAHGAMCYYHPYINDTAVKIKNGGYKRLIIVPLYPHNSSVTTGACFKKLQKAMPILSDIAEEIKIITHWYGNKSYTNCISSRIENAAKKLGKNINECHIVFSAHSLPQAVADSGDPYTTQIKAHAESICNICKAKSYEISYQSKVGPVKWVGPSTIEALAAIKRKGLDNIIVVPISFISDHIETLIELDEQLIPTIKNSGINIVRSESLNADDDFVAAVADIITGA